MIGGTRPHPSITPIFTAAQMSYKQHKEISCERDIRSEIWEWRIISA
jgi:hypothetical protein